MSVRTMPGSTPAPAPEFRPYVYRGTGEDTLTAFMDHRPCGTMAAYKRHLKRKEKPCEDCAREQRRQWNLRQMKKAAA